MQRLEAIHVIGVPRRASYIFGAEIAPWRPRIRCFESCPCPETILLLLKTDRTGVSKNLSS